jgi:hypothetical protein
MRPIITILFLAYSPMVFAQSDWPEIEVSQDIKTPSTVAAGSFASPGTSILVLALAAIMVAGL